MFQRLQNMMTSYKNPPNKVSTRQEGLFDYSVVLWLEENMREWCIDLMMQLLVRQRHNKPELKIENPWKQNRSSRLCLLILWLIPLQKKSNHGFFSDYNEPRVLVSFRPVIEAQKHRKETMFYRPMWCSTISIPQSQVAYLRFIKVEAKGPSALKQHFSVLWSWR